MTPQAARIEMTELITYLLKRDLAIAAQTPIIAARSGGVREVCTPPPNGGRGTLVGAFGTLSEYRSILRSGDYLVLLHEGSILQTEYSFSPDGDLLRHRLAFFPCPVDLDPGLLEGTPDLETLVGMVIDELRLWPSNFSGDTESEDTPLRLRAPLRFDFEREVNDELHSPCHLHMAPGACRIPVYGPLSIGHFVRFVFRHFIHETWVDHEGIRKWNLRHFGRTIGDREREEIFIESRELVA